MATASDRGEPALAEVLLVLATIFALHLLIVCRVKNFWDLVGAQFDNAEYLEIVTIIRNWHSPGTGVSVHFWGFPYAIAAISKVFAIQGVTGLVLISMLGSLAVCILVHRLYGGWVATVFIFVDFEWIQLSVEGSSEPLFMCLLYASFLAARSDRWNLAALLASFSTTVRPVGVFALVAFAAVLAMRRRYRQLAVITLIGLGIGILYLAPVWMLVGGPLGIITAYQQQSWGIHGWPVTYPFRAWVSSYLLELYGNTTRWPMLIFFPVWLVVGLVGTISMWFPHNRRRFSGLQLEALFASIYTLFFLSYVDTTVAATLSRYLIPVLPLLLFSLRDWIPRDRRALWGTAALSALLASAGMVGFKNVFGFKLP